MNQWERDQAKSRMFLEPTYSAAQEQRLLDEAHGAVMTLAQELARADIDAAMAQQRIAYIREQLEWQRGLASMREVRLRSALHNERLDKAAAEAGEGGDVPPQVEQSVEAPKAT